MGTRELKTPRLLLRPFRPEDGDAMFRNWARDPQVTRYLTWQAHADLAVSRQLAAHWAAESEKADSYQWAIVPHDLGEPIGSISVVKQEEVLASCELGYCIGKAWWGQGLTAEALRAVIEYLIREVGFLRVSALHDADNPNSGKVMRKAGMRREGTLRRSGKNNSNPCCDLVLYSILAEELDKDSGSVFRPVARVKQALSKEDCVRILTAEKRGVLALLGDGDYPYAVPINHWYDPGSGKLFFHSGPSGHKIDALRRWEKASFCVTEQLSLSKDGWSYDYNSVIVFGRLELVRDHAQALEISRQITRKFTMDEEYLEAEIRSFGANVLCFALLPEQITGKRVHER